MSRLQATRAVPERDDHPARLLPLMTDLRREVRALGRRAHRIALAQASAGQGEYQDRLQAVFGQWIDDGAPHVQVVCFAAASEFDIAMPRHAERCRLAVMRDGSPALRALFWAALYRTRRRADVTAPMADEAHAEPLRVPAADEAPTPAPHADVASGPLCARCERLRLDARCAAGHRLLRPLGAVRSRSVGGDAVCETREHQCGECLTRWTAHRSAATPFIGWTIGRRSATD